MPLNDGCRFDQHHGVEDLRPDSVKPHPEQPVGGEKPRPARSLPTQDSHLVSQSDELEFQRSAAAYPVLAQNVFGFGIGRPTIATGNSLSGDQSLGQSRDLAIMDGLGRPHIGAAQLWHGASRDAVSDVRLWPRRETKRQAARNDDGGQRPLGRRRFCRRRVGVSGGSPDNPCRARDAFSPSGSIESTTTARRASDAHRR